MSTKSCPVCGTALLRCDRSAENPEVYLVDCDLCGMYSADVPGEAAILDEAFAPRRHLLSGVLRNASDAGRSLEVTSANLDSLVSAARAPASPLDSLDPVLEYAAQITPRFGARFAIGKRDFPKFFLRSSGELNAILEALEKLGRVDTVLYPNDGWQSEVTIAGWQHLEANRSSRNISRQAFVAMWFDASVTEAWLEGIRPALRECGYQPFRVDAKEHNDQIDDVIMAELRRSGLIVADFTGHRGGVYFEAGFGIGRGIPVIWSIRADALGGIHFDTRQYNHIVWETPADLRAKLRARIMATLPVYPALPVD